MQHNKYILVNAVTGFDIFVVVAVVVIIVACVIIVIIIEVPNLFHSFYFYFFLLFLHPSSANKQMCILVLKKNELEHRMYQADMRANDNDDTIPAYKQKPSAKPGCMNAKRCVSSSCACSCKYCACVYSTRDHRNHIMIFVRMNKRNTSTIFLLMTKI